MTSTTTRFADPLQAGIQGSPQRGRSENPFAEARQAARERSVSTSRRTKEKLTALIQEQSALIEAQGRVISSLTLRVEVLESKGNMMEQLLQEQKRAAEEARSAEKDRVKRVATTVADKSQKITERALVYLREVRLEGLSPTTKALQMEFHSGMEKIAKLGINILTQMEELSL